MPTAFITGRVTDSSGMDAVGTLTISPDPRVVIADDGVIVEPRTERVKGKFSVPIHCPNDLTNPPPPWTYHIVLARMAGMMRVPIVDMHCQIHEGENQITGLISSYPISPAHLTDIERQVRATRESVDRVYGAIEAGKLRGPKGDPGERGERGERGKEGPEGPQGRRGARGSTGVGLQGERGKEGPKGDKGNQGDRGPRGYKGEKGADGVDGGPGPKGDPGDKGDRGEKGEKGDQGEKGEKGDQGPRGLSFVPKTLLKEYAGADRAQLYVGGTGNNAYHEPWRLGANKGLFTPAFSWMLYHRYIIAFRYFGEQPQQQFKVSAHFFNDNTYVNEKWKTVTALKNQYVAVVLGPNERHLQDATVNKIRVSVTPLDNWAEFTHIGIWQAIEIIA